jgi:hypothetical protein
VRPLGDQSPSYKTAPNKLGFGRAKPATAGAVIAYGFDPQAITARCVRYHE